MDTVTVRKVWRRTLAPLRRKDKEVEVKGGKKKDGVKERKREGGERAMVKGEELGCKKERRDKRRRK